MVFFLERYMTTGKDHLYLVHHVARYLRGQYCKVVRCKDEEYAGNEPVFVPDEIFIKDGEVFQSKDLGAKDKIADGYHAGNKW